MVEESVVVEGRYMMVVEVWWFNHHGWWRWWWCNQRWLWREAGTRRIIGETALLTKEETASSSHHDYE